MVLPWSVRGLDDAHPPVVEIGGIVVVGDLPLGLAGGDLDRRRLEAVDCFVQGKGGLIADEIHVLEIAGVPPFAVGKGVTIGSAMRVGRSDQDVIGRNAADLRADAISQHRWKSDQVESHDGHGDVAVSKDDGTSRDVAFLFAGWVWCAHPAGDGQKRVRRDHAHRGADLKLAGLGCLPGLARSSGLTLTLRNSMR